MFGNCLTISARLIDHQNAALGTGFYIDRIVTSAARRHEQELGRTLDQHFVDHKMCGQVRACGTHLIDMRRVEYRQGLLKRRTLLQPVENNVPARGDLARIFGVRKEVYVEYLF